MGKISNFGFLGFLIIFLSKKNMVKKPEKPQFQKDFDFWLFGLFNYIFNYIFLTERQAPVYKCSRITNYSSIFMVITVMNTGSLKYTGEQRLFSSSASNII